MTLKKQMRREFVSRHCDVARCRILEIGALNDPLYDRTDHDVHYLDWFSREELLAKHAKNPHINCEAIVPVDFVVKEKSFARHLDPSFDLVVANHVIEHVPDVIFWVQQIEEVLSDQGCLFLAVPDRKFTFDYLRRATDITDFLKAYENQQSQPDKYQIFSDIYYYRPIVETDAWQGRIAERLSGKRFSLKKALQMAEELSAKYTDVHCHVFEQETFLSLWTDIMETGLVQLQVREGSSRKSVDLPVNEF